MTLTHNSQTFPSISEEDVNEPPANFSVEDVLQTIENVLTGIERSQSQTAPVSYPPTETPKKLVEWRAEITQTIGSNGVDQSETNRFEGLDLWRKSLVERDREISAFDLRTFCSNANPQFENEIYYMLAGFYRNLSRTVSVLSKFDYVITHYFSSEISNNRRALRMSAEEVVAKLRQFNLEWGGEKADSTATKSQIRESIFSLSKLSVQAKTHTTVKSWLESGFFNHSREIKRGLGETFFVPEVTATVILYNLTVGNRFASLCEADSGILSDASGNFPDDKDAHNSVTNQLNSSFQTLLYSHLEDDFAESMAHERLTNLFSSMSDEVINKESVADQLSLPDKDLFGDQADPTKLTTPLNEIILTNNSCEKDSGENTESGELTDNQDSESIDVNIIKSQTADKSSQNTSQTFMEMGSVLRELSRLAPDREIIKNYLQKSATTEIRNLRFNEFLDFEKETDDKNLRRVLRLIISAEETIRLVTGDEGDLSPSFSDELHLLNEEIQLVSNRLRRLMNGWINAEENVDKPQKDYFEKLLYASNILIETQLRLNSTMVRRQNKEDESQSLDFASNEADDSKFEKIKVLDSSFKPPAIISLFDLRLNRWLLAVTVIVTLLGGTWLVYDLTLDPKSEIATNVQTLDPMVLHTDKALIAAKISKNTLYGFVDKKWNLQTLEEKKVNLKLLLDEGGKYGFNKVFLINQDGELIGNASETSITAY